MKKTIKQFSWRKDQSKGVFPFFLSGLSLFVSGLYWIAFGAQAQAQVITSDGSTSTTVTIAPNAPITVSIAPANSASVSLNNYSRFSVPVSGVVLDNSGVGAHTIVNQVTSANTTSLEGALSVLGQKADVIIANPNGISVDGTVVSNADNLAIVTGRMTSSTSGELSAQISGGEITVGADGLGGTISELALLSATLRANGPIGLKNAGTISHVNILTGQGRRTFDRLRHGAGVDGSGILPWAMTSGGGVNPNDAIVVNLNDGGAINGGQISITVTDQGAGVRIADDQLASIGGFRLTSTGTLVLESAAVAAQGSVNVASGEISLASSIQGRSSVVSEESGVVLQAKTGSIDLGDSRIAGSTIASDNLNSSGGVTLVASGDILAQGTADWQSELVSEPGGQTVADGSSNVVLSAGGSVLLSDVSVAAADDFRTSASGAIAVTTSQIDAGKNIRLLSFGEIIAEGSVLTADSDVRIDGTLLRFGTLNDLQPRTEIVATNGGLVALASDGDILNYGSLLQGSNISDGDAQSLGGVSFYATGDFVNQSLSVDRLAVAFGKSDGLHLEAGGDVINLTGRLFSNSGITLDVTGDVRNETAVVGNQQPFALKNSKGNRYAASLFLKKKRITTASADFGELVIEGERSYILGIEDVSVSAINIYNLGGDITGADVTLNAARQISNEARQSGSFHYRQTCSVFCSIRGRSDLQATGGVFTASKLLRITAGDLFYNLGGTIEGSEGVVIDAPLSHLDALTSVSTIELPPSFFGFSNSRRGYLSFSQYYGGLRSSEGDITINGDVILGDLVPFASGELTVNGKEIEAEKAKLPKTSERPPIGIFWSLF